uniref:F-box domain-containing protein n=1 Tax=Trichobilharzia regenti TaxID=157069 RepID=A0AA85JVU3_TRIRE|nr:unnamed protein product [Trichobilharzia regenti]
MVDPSNNYGTANDLPPEILLRVFNYLSTSDLISCISVCTNWRQVALDNYLWQKKLVLILRTRWSTLICDSKPSHALDLQRLQTIHPYKVYHFLKNFVPQHLLTDQKEASKIQLFITKLNGLSISPNLSEDHTGNRFSFSELFWNWFNSLKRRFSIKHTSRINDTVRKRCRFAIFGPGFDQRATSCLFSKLVDVKTKSFEPLNMIPGRMGFGAGLTLRLHNQAQIASLDSSLYYSNKTCERIKYDTRQFIQTDTSTTCSSRGINHLGDFIFDLHYLYSLSGHLSHKFSSQLERIKASRLFTHSDHINVLSNDLILNNLVVSDEMRNLLHGICGLIYAVDARETTEQAFYLYTELKTVLKGFPNEIAHKIPIVILYIMPVEEILQDTNENDINLTHIKESKNEVYLNRDSYSGADYTFSWCGSLLQPLTCLHLFEFQNPWRLQKCASNDIKAVIQSFMWLRSRHPNIKDTTM